MVQPSERRAGGAGWLANLPMAVKFLAVIGVTAAVSLAVTLTAISGMSTTRRDADMLYSDSVLPLVELNGMQSTALTVRMDLLNAGLSTDRASVERFLNLMATDDAAFDQALAAYAPTVSGTAVADLDALRQRMTGYRQVRDNNLVPAARRLDRAAFVHLRDTVGGPAFAKVAAALATLIKRESDAGAAADATAKRTASSARLVLVIVLLVGLAVALALGLVQSRVVVRSIRRVGGVAEALGRGDLTQVAGVTSRDEIGRAAAVLDWTGRPSSCASRSAWWRAAARASRPRRKSCPVPASRSPAPPCASRCEPHMLAMSRSTRSS